MFATTAAPGSPIDPAADVRVALSPVPDGLEPAWARRESAGGGVSGTLQLFAADGTTWDTGPWVLVATGAQARQVWFRRPPVAVSTDAGTGWVGASGWGDETTVLDPTDSLPSSIAVVTKGLEPGAGASIGAMVGVDGNTVNVPASAVPGMHSIDPGPVARWFGGSSSTSGQIMYGGSTYVQVESTLRDGSSGSTFDGRYFLSGVRYLTIGGHPAVAGMLHLGRNEQPVVTWTTADRVIIVSGDDGTLDELIDLADDVVLPTDPAWRDALWEDAAGASIETEVAEGTMPRNRLAQRPGSEAGEWSFSASAIDSQAIAWTAQLDAPGSTIGFRASVALPGPALDVQVSRGQRSQDFAVMAFAAAEATSTGALLRLTVDGATHEVALHPPEDATDLPGLLVAGIARPWTAGGFTVELVAADGTVIATRSDADVP